MSKYYLVVSLLHFKSHFFSFTGEFISGDLSSAREEFLMKLLAYF